MKITTLIFLVLTQISFGQSDLDHSGFNKIRLGKSYESLKNSLTEVETPPEYAWFAPMTIEYYMDATGEDSSDYYEMLETDRLIAESLNTKILWCTFNKKKDANYFKFPIECAQLVFTNDILIGISLVFDKNDMTTMGKETIIKQFELALGSGSVNRNFGNPIKHFSRNWKLGNINVRVSDASWDLGTGESFNVIFESFDQP